MLQARSNAAAMCSALCWGNCARTKGKSVERDEHDWIEDINGSDGFVFDGISSSSISVSSVGRVFNGSFAEVEVKRWWSEMNFTRSLKCAEINERRYMKNRQTLKKKRRRQGECMTLVMDEWIEHVCLFPLSVSPCPFSIRITDVSSCTTIEKVVPTETSVSIEQRNDSKWRNFSQKGTRKRRVSWCRRQWASINDVQSSCTTSSNSKIRLYPICVDRSLAKI